MLRRALDLLAPPSCWACGGVVHAGLALCPGCAAALPWRERPERLPPGSALDGCLAALTLAAPASDLVHALKFRDAPPVAALMAAHLVLALPPWSVGAGTAIVPVPAHPARRRRRGYDHADALARALAARTGAPLAGVLERAGGRAARQRGAGRAERLAGGSLTIRARSPAPPGCLLVDDVRTTGATLEACARALRDAGARRVSAVAYAQAP